MHNFCISHKKPVAINAELNELYRPNDAIRVEPQHKRPGALTQGMWIWPGIQLLGAMTEGENVRNNQVRYEAAEVVRKPDKVARKPDNRCPVKLSGLSK